MPYTPDQVADHLRSRGAHVRQDANFAGREWVHAILGDRNLSAAWYLSTNPSRSQGPGSGQFSSGHVTTGAKPWPQRTDDLDELLAIFGVPMPGSRS